MKPLRNSDVKKFAYTNDKMGNKSLPGIIFFFQDLFLVHRMKIHFQSKGISFDWIE
jgi:hypothetical protein